MESNFDIEADIKMSEQEIKIKAPKKFNWFKFFKIVGIIYLFNLLCINTYATYNFYKDIAIPFLGRTFSTKENIILLFVWVLSVSAITLSLNLIYKKWKKT